MHVRLYTTGSREIQHMISAIQGAVSATVVIAPRSEDNTKLQLNMIRAIQDMTSLVQCAIYSRLVSPLNRTNIKENLMARIRLNLRNLSVTEKIAKGRQIVGAITNNARFPNPTPALTDVTAAVDDLEKAFGSVKSAKSEVSTRVVVQENAETRVDQFLTQLAGYVESIAGKDDTIITSAGMETKASRSTPTTPGAPEAVSAAAGNHDGVILLTWKPVSYAKSYTIESTTDPAAATWAHVAIATSATKAINNLKSGTRYWFRVAAVSAGGQSGWSEHATKVAP
jgi:hypothetical protein